MILTSLNWINPSKETSALGITINPSFLFRGEDESEEIIREGTYIVIGLIFLSITILIE